MSNTTGSGTWGPPPGARSDPETLAALQAVYIEVERLYHQSNAFIDRIYQRGEVSLARRSVLLTLLPLGTEGQTVPQLARGRSVSRQYMQRLVNALASEGLVETVPNPAHKRSPFIRLSERGRTYLLTMLQREVGLVARMEVPFEGQRLRDTAEALQAIRQWQQGEMERLLTEEATRGQPDEGQTGDDNDSVNTTQIE
jgi:DNA-binding MarR family transcriptional regulator